MRPAAEIVKDMYAVHAPLKHFSEDFNIYKSLSVHFCIYSKIITPRFPQNNWSRMSTSGTGGLFFPQFNRSGMNKCNLLIVGSPLPVWLFVYECSMYTDIVMKRKRSWIQACQVEDECNCGQFLSKRVPSKSNCH